VPRPYRFGLLAFAAYLLLGSAWALALPANGTYDEKQHIVRAYAVADGQLLPSGERREESFLGTDAFRVPVKLLPGDPHCLWYPRPQPASCQLPVHAPGTELRTSGAARYSPVYYAPVGLPMRWWPGSTGILLGRLVSVLLGAVLIGFAAGALRRLGGGPPLAVGQLAMGQLTVGQLAVGTLTAGVPAALAVAVTPMTVNLIGAINPNGLEIAAGVLLLSAGLALVGRQPEPGYPTRRLVWLAGVAVLLLLTLRQLGPLLVALDVLAVALAAPPGRLRELLRRRDVRLILGGATLLGLGYALAWSWYARAGVPAAPTDRAEHLHGLSLAWAILVDRLPFDAVQLVGQFGQGETHAPPVLIICWYALVVAVIGPALLRGSGRVRAALLTPVLASVAVLVALDAWFGPSVGWVGQGRYLLPVLVGAPLIAAARRPAGWPPPFIATVVGSVALLHIWALVGVLARYRLGPGATDPLAGGWRPPFGPVLPIVLVTVGAVLLAATVLVVAGTPGRRYPPVVRPSDEPAVAHR